MADDKLAHLDVRFSRTLTGDIDTTDVDAQWAWATNRAEAQVMLGSGVDDTLLLFRQGDVLSADVVAMIGEQAEGGSDDSSDDDSATSDQLRRHNLVVAVLRHVLGDDVTGRYRTGEATVPGADGPQPAAVVLRIQEYDPAWQVRWRHFVRGDQGVGAWRGDWQEATGLGIEDAPAWLLPWVDDRKAEVTNQQLGEDDGPLDLDIRAARLGRLALESDDPREVAVKLHESLDREILAQGLQALLLFVVRADDEVERWELRRIEPFNLDDMVRAICAMEPAVAVALVHPANVQMPDGRNLPGIATVAHRGDKQVHRALPIDAGPDGPQALPPIFLDVEDVVQPWLDTPPSVPIELTPLLDDSLNSWPGETPEA